MKKKLYFKTFLCFLILSLSAPFVFASDLTSSSFIIRDPLISAGGGYGTSSSFQFSSSLDPVLIGVGTSASFIGHYGFLYFEEESAVVVPAPGGAGGGSVGLYTKCRIADFNCDGHVNIFDLSILLYYLKNPGSTLALYDLSEDGAIDFIDISIMFYYWDEV